MEDEEVPRRNRRVEPPARQPRRAARSPSAARPGGAAVVLRRRRLPRLGRGSRSIPRAASRNVVSLDRSTHHRFPALQPHLHVMA